MFSRCKEGSGDAKRKEGEGESPPKGGGLENIRKKNPDEVVRGEKRVARE